MRRAMLVVVALVGLACEDDPARPEIPQSVTPLPFVTLVADNLRRQVWPEGLYVIRTFEEAMAFRVQYPTGEMLRLVEIVDYDQQLAVAVVRGPRSTNNYLVTIHQIVSDGERITIHALESGDFGNPTTVWPLQIVRIDTTELPIDIQVQYDCNEPAFDCGFPPPTK